jgi:ABC-type uncharacterized transport system ATPase subunit
MQEVGAMASRAILIDEGSVVFDGPIAQLTADGRSLDEHFRELTAGGKKAAVA